MKISGHKARSINQSWALMKLFKGGIHLQDSKHLDKVHGNACGNQLKERFISLNLELTPD